MPVQNYQYVLMRKVNLYLQITLKTLPVWSVIDLGAAGGVCAGVCGLCSCECGNPP